MRPVRTHDAFTLAALGGAVHGTDFNPKLVDFTSKRIGNYQFSKQFYMLVDQLWVK